MYILAVIDSILIGLAILMFYSLPTPWYNTNYLNSLTPLVLLEKKAINNFIVEKGVDSLDLTKEYSIYVNNMGKVILKEGCGKIQMNPLGFLLSSAGQTYGDKYCIRILSKNPLQYNTYFPQHKGLILKGN